MNGILLKIRLAVFTYIRFTVSSTMCFTSLTGVLTAMLVVPLEAGSEEYLTEQAQLYRFTPVDIQFLAQFSLSQLNALPKSSDNRVADNIKAAALGKQLFFDENLSRSKQVSCRSCHQPGLYFTDGLKRSKGIGTTLRSSPTLLGAAYSPWQFWDGRKDSLWSQALGPIEDANEFNTSRSEYVALLLANYLPQYQAVFGTIDFSVLGEKGLKQLQIPASPAGNKQQQRQWQQLPQAAKDWTNRVFTNAGKSIMAYERQLKLPRARFDHFVDTLALSSLENKQNQLRQILSPAEVRGMRLFVGKGNCASCHNGPFFTNYEFHNIGAPEDKTQQVELGRYQGVQALVQDEFTCLSRWSDADTGTCAEMRFLKKSGPELVGALKTPTLRNIAKTAPYMQFGQFGNLKQVIEHYNQPTPPVYNREQHPSRPHFDILPLKLSGEEIQDLIAFLQTLTSPLPANDRWWGLEQPMIVKNQGN